MHRVNWALRLIVPATQATSQFSRGAIHNLFNVKDATLVAPKTRIVAAGLQMAGVDRSM
jgi:hypothetical protein